MWNWIEFLYFLIVMLGLMGFILWVGDRAVRRNLRRRDQNAVDSDQARMDQLMQRAIDVFGSEEKARRWLNKPKRQFNGKTPMQVATTEEGLNSVMEELNAIDAGFLA